MMSQTKFGVGDDTVCGQAGVTLTSPFFVPFDCDGLGGYVRSP